MSTVTSTIIVKKAATSIEKKTNTSIKCRKRFKVQQSVRMPLFETSRHFLWRVLERVSTSKRLRREGRCLCSIVTDRKKNVWMLFFPENISHPSLCNMGQHPECCGVTELRARPRTACFTYRFNLLHYAPVLPLTAAKANCILQGRRKTLNLDNPRLSSGLSPSGPLFRWSIRFPRDD